MCFVRSWTRSRAFFLSHRSEEVRTCGSSSYRFEETREKIPRRRWLPYDIVVEAPPFINHHRSATSGKGVGDRCCRRFEVEGRAQKTQQFPIRATEALRILRLGAGRERTIGCQFSRRETVRSTEF